MNAEKFVETIKGTNFECDLLRPMNIQGTKKSLGLYNLMVLKSEVRLYSKTGMKPNRQFKISAVKTYLGIKGTPAKMLEIMEELFEFAKDKNFITEEAI